MKFPSRFLLSLVLLAVAGCGDSDSPLAPDDDGSGPPEIVSFFVTDDDVVHGEYTQLRWELKRGESASISPDLGLITPAGQGARSLRPYRDVTYTLTVTNPEGSASADVTVRVTFPDGVYVDSEEGDDGADGSSPTSAVATLTEALARTTGGGTIYLSGGVYETNVELTGPGRLIFGSLNTETFFEDPELFPSIIRPSSGTPVRITGSGAAATLLRSVQLDARFGGTYALEVEDSFVFLQNSLFDARLGSSGTAIDVKGTSSVEMHGCRVFGGNMPVRHDQTRGIRLRDSSDLKIANSFVSGGWAQTSASGVDLDTSGLTSIALCTVSARSEGTLGGEGAVAVRIRRGRPALGGNILFTQGSGERHAVAEESDDADPVRFEGNLLFSAGTPPYDNWSEDGEDPINESGLNDYQRVNDTLATVRENRLSLDVTSSLMFVDPGNGDYHLLHPMINGNPNPAVDNGSILLVDVYGFTLDDIDGDRRPSSWAQIDRGADEH